MMVASCFIELTKQRLLKLKTELRVQQCLLQEIERFGLGKVHLSRIHLYKRVNLMDKCMAHFRNEDPTRICFC